MAIPSPKSPEVEAFLELTAGRTSAIRSNTCIRHPLGCGKPVDLNEFRDELSRLEYNMSGMCQACQDKTFGVSDS